MASCSTLSPRSGDPPLQSQSKLEAFTTFLKRKSLNKQPGEDKDIVTILLLMDFFDRKEEIIMSLMSLEVLSLMLKLWHRRISLIREENNDEYNGLKDFERAIRNAQEATKECKHSMRTGCYKEELTRVCQEERVKDAVSRVWAEMKKVRFGMTEEDLVRFQSPLVWLCSLLGLKLDFLDCLEQNMPQEHRNHRELSDWIEIVLEENCESLASADKRAVTKELLESIGFDPLSTATETIMARTLGGSMQQHIEACEWAQIYIKDEFKYNPLLSPKISKSFPFYSEVTNRWIPLSNIPKEEIESNINLSHVKIINLVTEEFHAFSEARTALSLSLTSAQDDRYVVLHHGTDYESACQILLRGIYLNAGRQKRDFSCGKGFYLTTSTEDALNWAKGTTAKPAVLTFVAHKRCFDNVRKLSLDENEDKWREVVSSFRTAKGTAITRESLNTYDLIEGPMATVTREETSDELVFNVRRSSYQMCLISDDFAEEFEKTLHSIVFFLSRDLSHKRIYKLKGGMSRDKYPELFFKIAELTEL